MPLRATAIPFVITCLSLTTISTPSHAVVVVIDDFDGGGQFTSRTISPDNSGNNGAFAGSTFDVFGITNRNVNVLFADDSIASADDFGIAVAAKTDNFFGVEDLDNLNNSGGTGSATWTLSILGLSDLSLSIDVGAMGVFETGDNTHNFAVSIDGGSSQTLFAVDANESINLTYTLEDGTMSTLSDPLEVTGTDTGTVTLDNNLTTYSESVLGTGSTLTLTYTAGQNDGGGVFAFDNITLSGTAAAVPEPSALLFGGLACGLCGLIHIGRPWLRRMICPSRP